MFKCLILKIKKKLMIVFLIINVYLNLEQKKNMKIFKLVMEIQFRMNILEISNS